MALLKQQHDKNLITAEASRTPRCHPNTPHECLTHPALSQCRRCLREKMSQVLHVHGSVCNWSYRLVTLRPCLNSKNELEENRQEFRSEPCFGANFYGTKNLGLFSCPGISPSVKAGDMAGCCGTRDEHLPMSIRQTLIQTSFVCLSEKKTINRQHNKENCGG